MSDKLYRRFVPGYAQMADAQLAGRPLAGLADLDTLPLTPALPPDEVPLLTPELLHEIRAQLASEPTLTLELAQRAFDARLTENELHRLLDQLEIAFQKPDIVIAAADSAEPKQLPDDFKFIGMEAGASYQHRLTDPSYQDSDWFGYGINCGAAILKRIIARQRRPFRWHDDYSSHFVYPLGANARVALFADFGAGQAHSWYIAKFMAAKLDSCAGHPTAAIHLGDVYYAGRSNEVKHHFDTPLSSLAAKHELWNLAGNHDYYCGGGPYFDGIDARPHATGFPHRQEGSYFTLETPKFTMIVIDTEYHTFFGKTPRYSEKLLKRWLLEQITAAKAARKSVILMSADEPYSICDSKTTPLYEDITAELPADAIDLWLWGNTHYCAVFDHSERLRSKFYGSCIGHAGFPYFTQNDLHPSPTDAAPCRWVETEPRFPKWTGVRQDMGNNGFVMMELDDSNQSLALLYYDWTDALRATVKLSAQDGQLKHTMMMGHPRPPCR